MRVELGSWREEQRRRQDELAQEARETEAELQPLQARLRESEDSTRELQAKIAARRAQVHANEERISQLVAMVVEK